MYEHNNVNKVYNILYEKYLYIMYNILYIQVQRDVQMNCLVLKCEERKVTFFEEKLIIF